MPTTDQSGAKIHYQDTGNGKDVVLLLHAFPLHSGMWSRQIAALSPRFRVIAPDYPGLGKSTPRPEPSTMEFAGRAGAGRPRQRCGVDRAVVAGLSMGGYLAFELYRRRPGLFRGLALCDTKAGRGHAGGRRRARGLREERAREGAPLGGRRDDAEAAPAAIRTRPR